MATNELIAKAKTYFPNLQIKYKDQSILMKIVGKLAFFNPNFMTHYVTTFGNTVYLPTEHYVNDNPQAFADVFIHECTHMYDEKKFGLWYQLAYIFPQLLSAVCLALMVLITWKIMLPLALLILAPWPAPGRAYFERRAYLVQMYASSKLWNSDPRVNGVRYAQYFKNSTYYWMWPFEKEASFTQEAINIWAGKPACASDPALFQQVNDLIAAAKI